MSGLSADEKKQLEQILNFVEDPEFIPKLLFMIFDKEADKNSQNEIKAILNKLNEYELSDKKINALYHQVFEEIKKLAPMHEPERLFYRTFSEYENLNALSMADFKNNIDNETAEGYVSVTKKEVIFELKDIEKAASSLGTSTKKLFHYCLAKITEASESHTVFKIDIHDYAELNGIELNSRSKEKHFYENVRNDLKLLASLRIKTKKSGFRVFIGGFDYLNGEFTIEMLDSIQTAIRANGSRYMSIPCVLFLHKNKSPNSYACGVKLNYHYDNAGNAKNRTVISVKKLVEALPEISREQTKDWKRRQKTTLEKALDENIEVGFLHSWHYRAADGKTISAAEASKMTYKDYQTLMIEFNPKIVKTTAKTALKKLNGNV